jgi:hypothetical protein
MTSTAELLDALEWAVNLSGEYGFDEIPLDDGRAQMIDRLVEHLDRVSFRGTLTIEVHVGRFCMNFGIDGAPELAPPDQPAAECAQIGWMPAEATALGRRQTLAFANTVAAAADDAGILVETTSAGSGQPVIEYPFLSDYLTAGEWNEFAAINQRVEVRIAAGAESFVSRSDVRP